MNNPPTAHFLAPNAVHVSHGAAGGNFPDERPWLEQVLLSRQEIPAGEAELHLEPGPNGLRILAGEREILHEAEQPRLNVKRRRPYLSLDIPKVEFRLGLSRYDDGMRMALKISPDEAFYGWGEWFNAFQRTQGKLHLRIRDAISLLQGRETYSAIPIFFSSRGYAFWLLNSHTSRWQIDRKDGLLHIEADGPGADYILIYGPSFKRILETYTALTGRPPLLPRWAFGLWVTSYPQGHQEKVLAYIQEHRRRNIPLDAVILDYHWEEGFHNFRWRRSLFPDPDGFIAGLKALGVRLGLILTPFVNKSQSRFQKFLLNRLAHNLPPGLEQDDERALSEYEEARAGGYLAHPDARWWFGSGGMLDFSNLQAAEWWNARLSSLYRQGVDFIKNDDGEYLPEDGRSALGMDGGEYHNIYGFFYGRALYEGMSKEKSVEPGEPPARPLIYARSAWAGSQRYPALFLGDQKPTFEGMRSTLRAGLNLGLLGFAYWTADVFGLDGKTTPETHMRYAQWALLSPVARYFYRPPQIDDTRFPWSHDPQVEANFRKYCALRYRLLPYFSTLGWQAYQSGLPLLRPLLLEFQDDPRLAGTDDQAMIGESLMLCPVLQPGAASRRIRLPRGEWHDFWSAKSWQGPGEIDYTAPLDTLPLLVRGGSILLLGPQMQHIPETHRFDNLELHIWPPYPAQSRLYDDDGCSLAYQSGAYSLTQFQAVKEASKLRISISAAQGSFPGQAADRHVRLILHRAVAPQAVYIDGQAVDESAVAAGGDLSADTPAYSYAPKIAEISILAGDCPTDRETRIEIYWE